MKKRVNNIEVRLEITRKGLMFKEIAEQLRINPRSLSRLMRTEMSENKKAEVMDAIKKCVEKKRS